MNWLESKLKSIPVYYDVVGDIEFSSSIEQLNKTIINNNYNVEYYSYLKSSYWKDRRNMYIEHYDHTCQYCKRKFKKNLALHHITYDNLGHEEVGDLVLLCNNFCHYKLEQEKKNDKLKFDTASKSC